LQANIAKQITMNRLILTFCIFFFSLTSIASAQAYLKHTVAKGETITQIATKYKVTPFDIYKLNPDSQSGIKENDVILIPSAVSKAAVSGKTHTAAAKETLYSISRTYNVNVDELKKLNPDIVKDGLKVGQTVKIPGVSSVPAIVPEVKAPVKATVVEPKTVAAPASDKNTYHIVEPKETKFGIAKKYKISIAELEKKNPEIVASLPVGYKLLISGTAPKTTSEVAVEKPKPVVHEVSQPETTKTETVKKTTFSGFANYEVKPKETLFSLAKIFDITEEELIILNPTLKEGVKTGMILKVPGKGSVVVQPVEKNASNTSSAKVADLSKSVKVQDKKQLVLMLPFNATKIQGDTLKTIGMRLKKDAFLNMTLDFYSGALVAIDSAKALGLSIDVKILDSEESKTSSNVAALVQNNNLANADAIIGPFYQQYVEKVAELVGKNNVPVISPLSKEIGKPFANLYQAMPPLDCSKAAMFEFMKSKNGNIIIVSDPKKIANKEFINKNYPGSKFVNITDVGAVDVDNMKSLMVKDRINYVILDTEKTGMILSTTNALLAAMSDFQIQLAIIEPNETLDFEEISLKRLTILKMLYPSFTRENNSPEATVFENNYKKQNKIFPSQYATRGFDITFDTMLRLSQGKSFETSVTEDKTEQVESKFEYAKKDSSGYVNKGIYILEYQDDLSVKQVN